MFAAGGIVAVQVTQLAADLTEPLLYGRSSGLSPVDFLGVRLGSYRLVLAVPMTICFVVMGRHIERLKFLDVMLGALFENSTAPGTCTFAQRFTAGRFRADGTGEHMPPTCPPNRDDPLRNRGLCSSPAGTFQHRLDAHSALSQVVVAYAAPLRLAR
jgi:hypothetical protein